MVACGDSGSVPIVAVFSAYATRAVPVIGSSTRAWYSPLEITRQVRPVGW